MSSSSFKRTRVGSFIEFPDSLDPLLFRQFLGDLLTDHAAAINDQLFEFTSIAAAATVAHDLVLVSTGASNVVVTVPPGKFFQDRLLRVKKIDNGAGKVLIHGSSSEKIEDSLSWTVSAIGQTAQLIATGVRDGGMAWWDVNRS